MRPSRPGGRPSTHSGLGVSKSWPLTGRPCRMVAPMGSFNVMMLRGRATSATVGMAPAR